MKKEDWEKYEKARTELRSKFKKLRWKTRLVWLVYNIAADALLFGVLAPRTSMPLALGVTVFSTMLSTIMMLQRIKGWLRIEAEQEKLLMDNAPMGKIRLYE